MLDQLRHLLSEAAPAHPFLDSDGALNLRGCFAGHISAWISQESRAEGVESLLISMLHTALGSLTPALRDWNVRNDRLNRLPVELRQHCFSFLPFEALLLLSEVCTSWRNLAESTPALWTYLYIGAASHLPPDGALARALNLSQGKPLVIYARVWSVAEAARLDTLVSQTMRRVRALDIQHVAPATSQRPQPLPFVYPYRFLREAAPLLERLSYRCPGGLPAHTALFNNCAPRLGRLKMHGFVFAPLGLAQLDPVHLTALKNVTFLSVRSVSSFRFDLWLLPRLRTLRLDYTADYFAIPPLPTSHPLHHLVLKSYTGGVGKKLRDGGYSRVAVVQVEGYCADVITNALLASDTKHSLRLTVRLDERDLHLYLAPETPRHSGPIVEFRCDGFPLTKLHALFRTPASGAFDALTTLCIPRDFPTASRFARDDFFNHGLHRALFPVAPLPRLHTLTITCAPRAGDALLDPHILHVCGVLEAPALKRLQFTQHCVICVERIEPVCPRNLALFISAHLRYGDPVLEVLYISHDVGLLDLEDGGAAVEVLRSFVGTMIVA
ncbi:hypothetical protein AURDEDRAFT_161713 [Auricularia subglabra TFB-10046 SS5]|nr:hypothetical protein AURDEDRAFT_161713 [Auricularia subglabra TFB-10046 SS5]